MFLNLHKYPCFNLPHAWSRKMVYFYDQFLIECVISKFKVRRHAMTKRLDTSGYLEYNLNKLKRKSNLSGVPFSSKRNINEN